MRAYNLRNQGLTLAGLVSQSSHTGKYIVRHAPRNHPRYISPYSTRCLSNRFQSHRKSLSEKRHFASVADKSLEDHNKAVEDVSAQVKQFYSRKQKFRINHGSTNSTRQTSKGAHILDVSSLRRVLKVDPERKTALVEPNVPMDRLVEATLPYGLVPPVIMEFPGKFMSSLGL